MTTDNKELSILQYFQTNVKDFLNELVEQFPDQEDLLIMRIFLVDQIPTDMLINQFIKFVIPHRDKIKNRDEKFFLMEKGVFGKISSDKVLHFKVLWQSNRLDNDDKKVLWSWFDKFIEIIDSYQKIKKNN
jgi:hypothetical protein